jgi:hypothetical protein
MFSFRNRLHLEIASAVLWAAFIDHLKRSDLYIKDIDDKINDGPQNQ